MRVPFFNYPHVFTSRQDELLDIIRDVGERGAFILQKDLVKFEKNLARYLGAEYAIGVANGTDALIIAVRAAGIGPGDEVIFCSHTYVATAASIFFNGATPVPVECTADHMIDPSSVAAAVTSSTKAIIPTQLNGRTCDMSVLQEIADQNGLVIIEDAAQALGARFKRKAAATFGLAGTLSFYPAKNLGCLGDGGAIVTNDPDLYERMKLLRDHGRNEEGEVVSWGLNSRLDNLQAAILDFKLKEYDGEVARRREIAGLYQRLLGDVAQLFLPPAPERESDYFDVFQNYEIEAEHRDELQVFLKENGIGTVVQWGGKPVHKLQHLGFDVKLPYTEELFSRCLMLPMHTALLDEDVEYICRMIRKFYGYESE